MSEEQKDVSLLEQLRQQRQMFIMQRDQANANFQQLIGAIYACEVMIKKHEELEASENAKESESQGDQGDDQVNEQGTEQVA